MDDSAGNPLESTGTPLLRGTRRFSMNAGRTTKQGQQISSGKDHADYQATVGTMSMHPDDMKEIGVPPGAPFASSPLGARPPSNASKARFRWG